MSTAAEGTQAQLPWPMGFPVFYIFYFFFFFFEISFNYEIRRKTNDIIANLACRFVPPTTKIVDRQRKTETESEGVRERGRIQDRGTECVFAESGKSAQKQTSNTWLKVRPKLHTLHKKRA